MQNIINYLKSLHTDLPKTKENDKTKEKTAIHTHKITDETQKRHAKGQK